MPYDEHVIAQQKRGVAGCVLGGMVNEICAHRPGTHVSGSLHHTTPVALIPAPAPQV